MTSSAGSKCKQLSSKSLDLLRSEGSARRGGWVGLPIAEKRCLVDEDSYQPAFEGAFGGESWRVAGGGSATVFDCLIGFFSTVEDAECDEPEQFAAARELLFEGGLAIFAGFAVGLEVAAGSGHVDS